MADIAALLTDTFHIELEFTCESEPGALLRVSDFSLTEALSETFCADIELLTEDAVEPTGMLGRNGTFTVRRGGAERFVKGMVTRVEHGGVASVGTHNAMIIRVRLEPALCALKHTLDSRVFQNQNVLKIIEAVLKPSLAGYGRGLDLDKLKRVYDDREYTVQYAESDYDFVSRLAAQEGITFFFDHAGASEKVIFADDNNDFPLFETLDGQPVPLSRRADENPDTEPVLSFVREDQQGSTSSITRDFDWTRPDLELKLEQLVPDAQGKERTVYASTGETVIGTYDAGTKTYTKSDVVVRGKLLQERLHAFDAVYVGEGLVTGFTPGRVFELTDHVLPDLDGRYVLTSVTHNGGTGAGNEAASDRYRNHFAAVPFAGIYRPLPVTPWPRIHSIQTATVVGPPGSEIHTDEHGRIRVQFHWDREGMRDDHSSCFIRVAQQWAGAGYGFVFIPRVGHEVLVSFIEGNPDRPLVTGCVYNGEHKPFWELPANETRSVIRTKTFGETPAATGYNEISFEDVTDGEEILLHASRDFNETVEKDHNTTVHGKQSNTVDLSHSESVGGSQSLSVGGNRTVNITGSQSVTIKGEKPADGVSGGKVDITGDYKLDTSNTINIQAPTSIKLECGGSSIMIEPGKITVTAGDGSSMTLDVNGLIKSSQGTQVMLDANALVQSSGSSQMLLDANALVQSSGGSSVLFDANALVRSSGGSEVLLDANATASASGGGQLVLDANATMKGAEATVHGDMSAQLDATGNVKADPSGVTVTGTMIKLN